MRRPGKTIWPPPGISTPVTAVSNRLRRMSADPNPVPSASRRVAFWPATAFTDADVARGSAAGRVTTPAPAALAVAIAAVLASPASASTSRSDSGGAGVTLGIAESSDGPTPTATVRPVGATRPYAAAPFPTVTTVCAASRPSSACSAGSAIIGAADADGAADGAGEGTGDGDGLAGLAGESSSGTPNPVAVVAPLAMAAGSSRAASTTAGAETTNACLLAMASSAADDPGTTVVGAAGMAVRAWPRTGLVGVTVGVGAGCDVHPAVSMTAANTASAIA